MDRRHDQFQCVCNSIRRQNIIMINQWAHLSKHIAILHFYMIFGDGCFLQDRSMKLIGKVNKNKGKYDNRCLISTAHQAERNGQGTSWTNSTFTMMMCVRPYAYALGAFGFFQEWKKQMLFSIYFYGFFVLGSFYKGILLNISSVFACRIRCQKKKEKNIFFYTFPSCRCASS